VLDEFELRLREALVTNVSKEQAIELIVKNAKALRVGRRLPPDSSVAARIVRGHVRLETNREKGGKASGKRFATHWIQIEDAVLTASRSGKPTSRALKGIISHCISVPSFREDGRNCLLGNVEKTLSEITKWMKGDSPAKSGRPLKYTSGSDFSHA